MLATSSISRQPWSTYAVYLTTLSPPAFIGDLALVAFCYYGTKEWSEESRMFALKSLVTWMFVSKFIKLLGHYIRYPVDFLLLPVSILFGYFHGLIKLYAAFTLNVVSTTSPCSVPSEVQTHVGQLVLPTLLERLAHSTWHWRGLLAVVLALPSSFRTAPSFAHPVNLHLKRVGFRLSGSTDLVG